MSRLQRYRALRGEDTSTVDGRGPRRVLRLMLMTGSLAVLTSILSIERGVPDRQRMAASMRVLRETPLDVAEALRRIETAAAERGQAVIARLGAVSAGPLLVLGSVIGGTPVALRPDEHRPDLPLRVLVQPAEGGGAQVLVADSAGRHWDGLPDTLAQEIAALPGLVERALG